MTEKLLDDRKSKFKKMPKRHKSRIDNTFPGSGPVVIDYKQPTAYPHTFLKTKSEKYSALSKNLRKSKIMRNPKSYVKKSGDTS